MSSPITYELKKTEGELRVHFAFLIKSKMNLLCRWSWNQTASGTKEEAAQALGRASLPPAVATSVLIAPTTQLNLIS